MTRPLPCLVFLLSLPAAAMATPDAVIRTIALSGQPAPGLAGVTFADVSAPRQNAAGQSAFFAVLAGTGVTTANAGSLWRQIGPTTTLVLREGTSAPFPPATTALFVSGLSAPFLTAAGDLATPAAVGPGGTSSPTTLGFVATGPVALRGIALEGLPAPALNPAANFAGFANAAFNDAGAAAFAANRLTGGIFGTSSNGGGIWSDRSGALSLIAAYNQPAPGFTPAATFSYLESPAINASGALVFRANVAAAGLTNDTNSGLWSDRSGALAPVARAGDQVAGLPAGVLFREFAIAPSLTGAGRAIFWAGLAGPGVTTASDSALFASDPDGTLRVLAREGDEIPAAAARFGELSHAPSVSADGSVAFLSLLAGPAVTTASNAAVVLSPDSDPTPFFIARRGLQAPRLPAGVVFSFLGEPLISDTHLVAFTARVAGAGVTTSNNSVLYAYAPSPYSSLIPLVRTGDLITLAPGDVRTVSSIVFEPQSASVVGDSVLAKLIFADNSSGLFELRVPCLADFNADGMIDPDDLADAIGAYFAVPLDPRADFDGSGTIDPDDLSTFIAAFFQGCP